MTLLLLKTETESLSDDAVKSDDDNRVCACMYIKQH